MRAWRTTGAEVLAWFEPEDACIAEVLDSFRPTLFLGTLQQPNRKPARWTQPDQLAALLKHRASRELFVACRSGPSDMPEMALSLGIDATSYPDAGVASFYGQSRRPVGTEADAIRSGAIDLIRSPLASECYRVAFRSFLGLGLPVLEELHAADVHRYRAPISRAEQDIDVSFIGGCWPFKWANMEPYIRALRDAFGPGFRVWGKGWPEGVSEGPLDGDDAYTRMVQRSRVCIALHEPSQVIGAGFATNERPFKLLAMGSCVVSDPNPMLMTRFTDGEHLRFAEDPSNMVEIVRRLLADPSERARLAGAGKEHVLRHHTYDSRVERLLQVMHNRPEPGSVLGNSAEMELDAA